METVIIATTAAAAVVVHATGFLVCLGGVQYCEKEREGEGDNDDETIKYVHKFNS